MRYVWFGLLVLVVCTPLILVSILFAEAKLPALDGLTAREPAGIRTTIAAIAMKDAGYGKGAQAAMERVLRLDPENPDAWSRRCEQATYPSDQEPSTIDALSACRHAAKLDSTSYNWMNVGRAQEKAGAYCEAQQSYADARQLLKGDDAYTFRALGRAALLCGHADVAIVELNQAADTDAADLAGAQGDEDEADEYRSGLLSDREWLTFAYANTRQPALASKACGLAHPDWQNCSCEVVKGEIKCDGVKFEAKAKK